MSILFINKNTGGKVVNIVTKLNDLKNKILGKFYNFKDRVTNIIINLISKKSSNSYLDQPIYLAKIFSSFIVITSGFGIIWLVFVRTEQVIQTKGLLEPIDRLRSVQIPEKGIVDQLMVKEGEFVNKNQILIKLDNKLPNFNLNEVSDNIKLKKQIIKQKRKQINKTIDIFDIGLNANRKKYIIEKGILDQYKYLLTEGAISKNAYLSQKKEVIDIDSNYEKSLADKIRSLSVLRQEIDSHLIELIKLETKLLEIQNVKDINHIKSPINGYILDLKALGNGYVAQSTETILKIVPVNSLIGIIDINSSDIGFINIGKKVDISIDSFPARDFGSIPGSLYDISSSSFKPNNNNKNFHYKGKIRLNSQSLKSRKGMNLKLRPGMSLTANIKLRKASYLELLLSSFKDKAESIKKF